MKQMLLLQPALSTWLVRTVRHDKDGEGCLYEAESAEHARRLHEKAGRWQLVSVELATDAPSGPDW